MYNYSYDEAILIAKIFAYAFGDKNVELTELDKSMAYDLIKKMVDQRADWTKQQKEQYKALVDVIKRLT